MNKAIVIGAGLAGSEAAWQLTRHGFHVDLYEMRPTQTPSTHTTGDAAELICSNSFKNQDIESAQGLLKEELSRLGSLVMHCAKKTAIPAGSALAVDRSAFSQLMTQYLHQNPRITLHRKQVESIPDTPCIVATGPLTEGKMADAIAQICGTSLYFFDAAAPIVSVESLNIDKVFAASRHGNGSDYLNCPMTQDEYEAFWQALSTAQRAPLHAFDERKVFEGCLPVEILAQRGVDTLRYGAMKPVGLIDPHTGRRPYAVVQLRREDALGESYNLVGFQTNLKMGEQKRVFGMIAGLENAEYLRYGRMHRNSFLSSPGKIDRNYRVLSAPHVYIAGQLTGVEGYLACVASGFVAGTALARQLQGQKAPDYTQETIIGALGYYISQYVGKNFQPMGPSHGLLAPLNEKTRRVDRGLAYANRSLGHLDHMIDRLPTWV